MAKLPGGTGSCGSGAVGCNGERHKFEAVLHSPLRTSVVPSKILHCKASNEMVYPASQNFAVARSEAWASPGTMCALVASCHSHSMSTLHVWVEQIVAPCGNVIMIGLVSICLLTTWAPSQMKWLVAPELLRAVVVSLLLCCGPFSWTVCSL